MSRLLCLLMFAVCIVASGCDAQAVGRPPEVTAENRSNAPADACRDNDRYSDGLCDPGCLHPDPDCLDCSSAARRAVFELEDTHDRIPSRLAAEPMTLPDPEGRQMIRVLGDGVEYIVSAELDHEQGGAFSEFCTVHGLQAARRVTELMDSDADTVSVSPPNQLCADVASQSVLDLEYQAARRLLGPDGTRAVDDDANGVEAPLSDSRIAHVELVGIGIDGELLRVHVQRRGYWSIEVETYLVNTRIRTTDEQQRCEVVGLQNKTHQVDMRS